MSLFLGKIHFWLFNKILWFEGLEEEVIKLAKEEGLNIEKLAKELNLKYGEKLPNKKLEEIIDTDNIHGWLQSRIHSAEGRMAGWTCAILKNNIDSLEKLEQIYIAQGISASNEVKVNKTLNTAKEIYNAMNDYVLDGMPCDRVNEFLTLEDDMVEWKRRICVHKDIWERENLDVNIFYTLRDLWIKAFVNESNNKYEYIQNNNVYGIFIKK
ncbi:MAG: hypothetical protein ACRDD7_02525 [Peptostreptococcaceae bacterium]